MSGSDAPEWMLRAACRNKPTTTFFFDHLKGRHDKQVRQAKAVCAECPVCNQCFSYAFVNNVTEGVWGGYEFPLERS